MLGIRNAFWGFSDGSDPMELTPESVHEIHRDGGTILGSNRGGMRGYEDKILEASRSQTQKSIILVIADRLAI